MEQENKIGRLGQINYKKVIWFSVILLIILYYFIPRTFANVAKLSDISINDIKSIDITILKPYQINNPTTDYVFTDEEEMNQIVNLFQKTIIRKKIIDVESVSEGHRGYIVSFVTKEAKNLPFIYLFSDDIVSIDGKQYILNDSTFYDKLDTILGIKTTP